MVSTHPVHQERGPLQSTVLPVEGLPEHGRLVMVTLTGRGLMRPGDGTDTVVTPLCSMAEATIVTAGSCEFRDSLGHRGLLAAPGVRLVSGGSGLNSEIGPSRDMHRDGGIIDMVTLRWLQPGRPVVPTSRIGTVLPRTRQGRSVLTRYVGGVRAAVSDPGGTTVTGIDLAAGATVDLKVPGDCPALVIVRCGTALLGDRLRPVVGPASAVLHDEGTRLTVASHLEGDAGADMLVVTTGTADPPMVHRHGAMAAENPEELDAALEQARAGGFGRLPNLDG